ncbi:MAG: prepilin-type N-terminal cleavage/methylation domain-containing protein [Terriglobales bacterium]
MRTPNLLPTALRKRRRQNGFTLIETLIAGIVLVVGMLALMGLVGSAITSNSRSKLDSTATMLTQSVVEQVTAAISATAQGGDGSAVLTDCAGHTFTIASNTGGAALNADGHIDFSETAPPDGYHMNYTVCSGTGQAVYDVRWNISGAASGPNITSFSHLLTVGARLNPTGPWAPINFPINLRVMVGPDPPPES